MPDTAKIAERFGRYGVRKSTGDALAMFANHARIPTKGNIMPTRNINLTEHLDHFVKRQVSSGRYRA
jgi:hypothetical protein